MSRPPLCVPEGLNRADRRTYPRPEHAWKTGSDPSLGRFCAVCGTKQPPHEPGVGAPEAGAVASAPAHKQPNAEAPKQQKASSVDGGA